jgi:hypothetical protein
MQVGDARSATGIGVPGGGLAGVFGYQRASGSQLLAELAPTIATASAGAAAWAAFAFFGKRRRNDDEPETDVALAAAAAADYEAEAAPGLQAVDESLLPRWRRPSLQQVRRTDPLRADAEAPHLSFEAAGVRPLKDFERRHIGYRLVRLLDSPDELRSQEIGVLDQGDEVQLLERQGVYWLVLCPDGRQGWVHRMVLAGPTLARVAEAEPPEPEAFESPDAYEMPGLEELVEEPSTDGLLEAYMKARSDALRSMTDDQPVVPEPSAEGAAALEGATSAADPTQPEATQPEADGAVSATTVVEESSAGQPHAAEPGRAGERYSGRKSAGSRKASTASRPGAKSRRPSR